MTPTHLEYLLEQRKVIQDSLCKIEEAILKEHRLLREQVVMTRRGRTITLTLGERVIKVRKRNAFDPRHRVTEGGETLDNDWRDGIANLRLAIALGNI